MTKASIVVPVYNTASCLLRCLESIERQTLDSYEVLLIDDGSTDESATVCQTYIADKPQFRLIRKKNGGLTSARLRGWEEASGEFIVFVDSDDYLEPTYCEKLYEACVQYNCLLAICGYQVVGTDIKQIHLLPYEETLLTDIKQNYVKPLFPNLSQRIPAFLWLRMMKRECITPDCFVHENKVFTEDLVFDLQYARKVEKLAVINEPLYNYVVNDNSLTRKYRRGLWGMYKNLYEWCCCFCHEENIKDCDESLTVLLLEGMLHCMQQASHLDYSDFRADYDSVCQDELARGVFKSIGLVSRRFMRLSINMKVIYLTLRYMPPVFVYKFYRWRQNR